MPKKKGKKTPAKKSTKRAPRKRVKKQGAPRRPASELIDFDTPPPLGSTVEISSAGVVTVGRPTDYTPKLCELAAECYRGGATDLEVADVLGVHVATIYRWLAEHPEFCEAAKEGKDLADDRVERSLYHRAVGYTFDAVKIFNSPAGVVRVPYREHVPPDPKAAFNWLRNRRPEQWRDVKELGKETTETLAQLITQAAISVKPKVREQPAPGEPAVSEGS